MASVRTTTRRRRGIIWIPPPSTAEFKITIERADGTVDDISDLISSFELEDGVTDNIGRFQFVIWDPNEEYVNNWANMNIMRYYKDYASTATTLRFRGRVEKVSKQGNKVKVVGRAESLKFMEVTVTQQYVDTGISDILKNIVSVYGNGFTTNNVATVNSSLTVNWYQKPFWDCVNELCTAAGFDCYVDKDLDFNFFEIGSNVNRAEGIVHGFNLISVNDFADDASIIKNRVIVYGAEQDGTQILHTSEDSSSQDSFFVREEIISDSNITSQTQAEEFGDNILSDRKDPPVVGSVKGFLLSSVKPGDSIRLSSPADGLVPDDYRVIQFKDEINIERGGVPSTTIMINKNPRNMSHIFKGIITNANLAKRTTVNPFEMRFSFNFLFDEDSGTHILTEVTNGVLKLQSGETAGNWTSPKKDASADVSEVYLFAVGSVLDGAVFEVSADNGSNYQIVNLKTLTSLTATSGSQLRARVTFSNGDTEVDSLSILYKS